MKPINDFIVHIPKKFKDEVSFNGSTLKLVSKFNEFEHRLNYGKILGCPKTCPVDSCDGAILYFHHHVVMEQRYDIGEDTYMVTYDPNGGYGNHAIAIEDEAGNITMLGDWCFVAPADEPEEKTTASGIVLEIKKESKDEGELLNLPEDSEWIGASIGDVVGYTKNSDYKMDLLNGDTVYRMRTTELVYAKKD